MTSATMRRESSAGGRHAEGRGDRMVMFASILLFVISFFNMMYGIAAIANSHVFVANAHYVIGDLRAWGWVTLTSSVPCSSSRRAASLMGNQLARWFAVAVVGLNAIEMMFFIPAYPFWALVIIAADVVALWGLCAYGSRENLEAAEHRRAGPVPGWNGLGPEGGIGKPGPGPVSSDGTCSILRRARAGFPSPAGSLVHRSLCFPGKVTSPPTVPVVRKQDPAGGAVSSSPRRDVRGNGIASFMLGHDRSAAAPVVHDHRAAGGQGGAGRPVAVAAQQQID